MFIYVVGKFVKSYQGLSLEGDVFEKFGMTLTDNLITACACFLHTNVGLGPFLPMLLVY